MWLESLRQNLSKNQKVGLFVGLQIIVVIVVLICFSIKPQFKGEKINVKKDEGAASDSRINEEEWNGMQRVLFKTVRGKFEEIKESDIMSAMVREDSYKKETKSGVETVNFLVDIDELKMTYKVIISRAKNDQVSDRVTVLCPPKSEMKYQETFCESSYNNTNSPELYLPNYYEEDKNHSYNLKMKAGKIHAFIVACEKERQAELKRKVNEYLASTPIDLNQYPVEYQVECYRDGP